MCFNPLYSKELRVTHSYMVSVIMESQDRKMMIQGCNYKLTHSIRGPAAGKGG